MNIAPRSAPAILLVEDDRDVREAIAEVLEQEGYVVATARTGVDALEWLRETSRLPSAVLLDLMMPVMDGWEFAAAQQGNVRWAHIPVVVMSADSNPAERAHSVPAIAYLRKPIDIEELLGLLGRVVDDAASTADRTPREGD